MPLPDERPRQSVANLIGRFEQQQNKRSSLVLPRSPSVLSQHTGESAKTEGAESTTKQWPPVQFSPSISFSRPTPAAAGQSPPAQPSAPVSVQETAPKKEKVEETVPVPVPEPPKPEPVAQAAPAPPSSFKNPTKSNSSRNSLPLLKPQTTGGSVRKSAGPKSTPPTPATAKSTPSTPARTQATPSRAKTPSSSTSRPKTPSSGLFAPTAASLAKARNAQPPTPTPVRKAALSSAVADRLSKPTAASLSKARTPTVVPARGKAASRGTATRGKAKSVVKKTERPEPAQAPSQPEPEDEEQQLLEHINGHSFEASQSTEEGDQEDEPQEEEEDREDEPAEEPLDSSHLNGKHNHEEANPVDVAEEPEAHDHSSGKTGNDIEDMVNLLETKARPASVASIPDEIPDE